MLPAAPQKQNQTPSQSKKSEGFFFQPKLTINQPNDVYEQEADAVADKVMRMPETSPSLADNKPFFSPPTVNINKAVAPKEEVQKKENKEEETEEAIPEIQAKLSFDGLPPPAENNKAKNNGLIQRKCADCEEEEKKMQRKEMNSSETVADTSTENYISSLNGKGRSLTQQERKFFEPRMGYDFSNVQLHTNAEANQSAKSINALAYTHGNHIAFAAGKYQPNTDSGKRLLAHELTHVIQQNRGTPGWLHGARQGLTIQRQTGTDYGLAGAGSQNKYVAEAVRLWTTKKSMKINDFVDALMGAIKTDLLSQGVPELKWNISTGGLGPSGSFNKWLMTINPTAFTERKVKITTVADLTLDEVRDVVGTLYHESRHADQDVLVIRVLLDQKKSVQDIVKETEIPLPIVNAVQATKFKTPPDAAQVAHATRAFAVMYGAHKELMQFLVKNEQVVPGVQELVTASSAKALKTAAPHLKKWAAFSTTVLEPKVKNLNALKTLGAQEAQLKQDLGALIGETSKLVAAFDSASKMKAPTVDDLEDLQNAAADWQVKFVVAYKNLESEKDAFAIEESVKKAFEKGATAKPTPAPTKK